MFAKQLEDLAHQHRTQRQSWEGPALAAGTGATGNAMWLIPLPPTQKSNSISHVFQANCVLTEQYCRRQTRL